MNTSTTTELAEKVIATLRAHEAELRQAGIRRPSLFGSVARGEDGADSDVDLAAEFYAAAEIGLFAPGGLERRLAGLGPKGGPAARARGETPSAGQLGTG